MNLRLDMGGGSSSSAPFAVCAARLSRYMNSAFDRSTTYTVFQERSVAFCKG